MRLNFHFLWLCLTAFSLAEASAQTSDNYKKATEGKEVVMGKLYPKNESFELSFDGGLIMNQSYVNTMLFGGGATYYLTENFGLNFSASIASNSDKAERTCIESFYYDPSNEVGVSCGDESLLEGADGNDDGFPRYGPAYVPIREMKQIYSANIVWAPVYGKQLFAKSTTSYFDLFVELGLGFATSEYYKKLDVLANGNVPRGKFIDETGLTGEELEKAKINNGAIGANPGVDPISYGLAGRPVPEDKTNPLLNLGIGQKFHFGKLFHIKVYIRNMTLIGTEQGFENLLALYGGVGVRF